MTSTTRTPLTRCSTKGCPFTPDEHGEWMEACSRAPEHGHRHDQPSHQHWPKKGMGGNNPKSKIVAVLCWPLHDRIDNKDFGNAVLDLGDRTKLYRVWDYKNETILEVKYGRVDNNLDSHGKPVGVHGDGADGGVDDSDSHSAQEVAMSAGEGRSVPVEVLAPEQANSPAPVGAGGESGSSSVSPDFSPALLMDAGAASEGFMLTLSREGQPLPRPASAFSRESWLSEGERLLTAGLKLKGLTDEWRYEMGDWVATGETHLGEEAYGHFSHF